VAWPQTDREIIARSELTVASSLHACITALSYGVPVARVPIAWGRNKFELLNEFEGIVPIDKREALSCLIQRGRQVEPQVRECADRLDVTGTEWRTLYFSRRWSIATCPAP